MERRKIKMVTKLGMAMVLASASSSGSINLGTFFDNLKGAIKAWGGSFIGVIGAFMLVAAAVMIAKAFMQHGRGQTNWLMLMFMIIVGGCFFVGGFNIMDTLANMGKQTLNDLATGTGISGTGGTTP